MQTFESCIDIGDAERVGLLEPFWPKEVGIYKLLMHCLVFTSRARAGALLKHGMSCSVWKNFNE